MILPDPGAVIAQPGLYQLTDDRYHGDPCPAPSLSSGIVKTLLGTTPKHAWQRHSRLGGYSFKGNQRRLDLGSLAHALVLGEGRDTIVIDQTDWRAKDTREAEREIREQGCIPVLRPDYENAMRMAEVAKTVIPEGDSEVAFLWCEGEVWCRSKPDRIMPDASVIYDYKTVGRLASPREFRRAALGNGYNTQAAWYQRGALQLLGTMPRFIFVAQELEPPHGIGLYEFDAQALARAQADCSWAIETWGTCLSSDSWPCYTPEIVLLSDYGEER
jgi:hypothetical protein